MTSFAFPPGDAPTGASSDSTDNTAARSRHLRPGELAPPYRAPAPACRRRPGRRHTAGGRLSRQHRRTRRIHPPKVARIHRAGAWAGGRDQFGWGPRGLTMTIDPENFSPAAGGLFTKKHICLLHLLGAGPSPKIQWVGTTSRGPTGGRVPSCGSMKLIFDYDQLHVRN